MRESDWSGEDSRISFVSAQSILHSLPRERQIEREKSVSVIIIILVQHLPPPLLCVLLWWGINQCGHCLCATRSPHPIRCAPLAPTVWRFTYATVWGSSSRRGTIHCVIVVTACLIVISSFSSYSLSLSILSALYYHYHPVLLLLWSISETLITRHTTYCHCFVSFSLLTSFLNQFDSSKVSRKWQNCFALYNQEGAVKSISFSQPHSLTHCSALTLMGHSTVILLGEDAGDCRGKSRRGERRRGRPEVAGGSLQRRRVRVMGVMVVVVVRVVGCRECRREAVLGCPSEGSTGGG